MKKYDSPQSVTTFLKNVPFRFAFTMDLNITYRYLEIDYDNPSLFHTNLSNICPY